MKKVTVLLVILASNLLLGFADKNPQCVFTYEGHRYDLNPLANPQKDYYLSYVQDSCCNVSIWMNLCRRTLTGLCETPYTAACQQWAPDRWGHAALARSDTLKLQWAAQDDGTTGLVATMTGGDENRKMKIDFKCDMNSGVGKPVFLKEDPIHNYIFQWNTMYACAAGSCSEFLSCDNCTTIAGCLWCLPSSECMESSKSETCRDWTTNPDFCPSGCSTFDDCLACTTKSNDKCGWCLSSNSCEDIAVIDSPSSNCQSIVRDANYCPY